MIQVVDADAVAVTHQQAPAVGEEPEVVDSGAEPVVGGERLSLAQLVADLSDSHRPVSQTDRHLVSGTACDDGDRAEKRHALHGVPNLPGPGVRHQCETALVTADEKSTVDCEAHPVDTAVMAGDRDAGLLGPTSERPDRTHDGHGARCQQPMAASHIRWVSAGKRDTSSRTISARARSWSAVAAASKWKTAPLGPTPSTRIS